MENLVVDDAAAALVASDGTAVGVRVPAFPPGRMVSALPVAGVLIAQGVATVKALEALGDASATLVGRERVYIPRMVWATTD